MIPILYEKNKSDYNDTWGLGLIKDCLSATVTEALNGDITAEIKIPYASPIYPELAVDRIIALHMPEKKSRQTSHYDDQGGKQPFRILSISKPICGYVTVQAEHVSGQLKKVIMLPGGAESFAKKFSDLPHVGSLDDFTFYLPLNESDQIYIAGPLPARKIPMTCREYMQGKEGSITDNLGYEWIFHGWTVRATKRRGGQSSCVIRYGKNLSDIKQEESIANVYTGIFPYWQKEQDGQVEYVAPDHAIMCQYADRYAFERIQAMDCSGEYQDAPTAAQLSNWAASYMKRNNWGVPDVSITIDFSSSVGSIGKTGAVIRNNYLVEYQELYLGDTVRVVFDRLGIDTTARVSKYTYDVLRERYISIDIGTIKPSITERLSKVFKKTGVKLK